MRIEGTPEPVSSDKLRGVERWPKPPKAVAEDVGDSALETTVAEPRGEFIGLDSFRTEDQARSALFGNLRGTLYEAELIRQNIDYLRGLADIVKTAGTYKDLLGGESEFSTPHGDLSIRDTHILTELGLGERALTFGARLKGPDYKELEAEKPKERYKFYSSFDLTTPEKRALGEQWFAEVATLAHERGLSLTTKSFDHTYDSLNLYTWDPEEMAQIIQELYPKYLALGLYSSTPHFLQGKIEGVDPDHVGFVQEPIASEGGRSHSGRMGVIGAVIDTKIAEGLEITPAVFEEAAREAGVDPAQPYLLAA